MLRILTAMGSEDLRENLEKTKEFIVHEKDIQYKEGIIETLKIQNKFDIIIIYEKLDGEIETTKLIKEIKELKNNIEIIFILENKNKIFEEEIKKENIKNIFYNNEINLNEFINKIKNVKLSEEENLKKEINELKKIIINKDKQIEKYKNNNIQKTEANKIPYKKEEQINNLNTNEKTFKKRTQENKKQNNKIISIIGKNQQQKNTFILKLVQKLNSNSIIIINFEKNRKLYNAQNEQIETLNIKKYTKDIKIKLKNIIKEKEIIIVNIKNDYYENYFLKKSEKIILICNNNIEEIKKYSIYISKLNKKYLIENRKINIIFNKKQNKIDIKLLKNIFKNSKILGKVELENNEKIKINRKILKNI